MNRGDLRLGRGVKHIDATSKVVISIHPDSLRLHLERLEAAARAPQYSQAWPWLASVGLLLAGGIRGLMTDETLWGAVLVAAAGIPLVMFVNAIWQAMSSRSYREVTAESILEAISEEGARQNTSAEQGSQNFWDSLMQLLSRPTDKP